MSQCPTLMDTMIKEKENTKCSQNDAFGLAISAKNALVNVYCYSLNLLMFGKNSNFPVCFP